MNNLTNTTLTVAFVPGFTNYVLAPFAFLTTVVNVFFFIIGLKTLKKKAHNMLVISMSCGDCLYGFSLFMLTVKNFLPVKGRHEEFCITQIAFIFIAMGMSLGITFLICVERFVTIWTNNYGILARDDKWKKKLAIGFLIFTTFYITVSILVVPRRAGMPYLSCYMQPYYDPYNYQVIMGLFSALFVLLALGIIVMYACIVAIMVMTFRMNKKIGALAEVKIEQTIDKTTDDMDNDVEDNARNSKDQQRNQRNTTTKEVSVSEINMVENSNLFLNSKSKIEDFETNKNTSSRDEHTSNQESSDNTLQYSSRSKPAKTTKQKNTWNKWELRAIATSGYVIVSTILLHGPLIICLVTDAIGMSFSPIVGSVSSLLVALQCVINPFIYAFRFKELREEIKKIICCKRQTSN